MPRIVRKPSTLLLTLLLIALSALLAWHWIMRIPASDVASIFPGLAPSEARIMHATEPELRSALAALGSDYQPRTRHLNEDGSPRYVNRLIREDSPYLLQHAHNPVNWYPWGPEAFARASAENKPVFLSIGYSTCHWCHVMEHESFESVEIAEILNQHFIAIKVDREQRPDVDDTYMMAVLLTMGQGGWPMSVWLTPEAKPFAGGTYFPPAQFASILTQVAEVWAERPEELLANAEHLTEAIRKQQETRASAAELDLDSVTASAVQRLLGRLDQQGGGFSSAPKFPNEALLLFLQDAQRRGAAPSLAEPLATAIDVSLDGMQRGGLFDQAGGGFHRYSTDSQWLVPHFEKMLYNQALLGSVYAAAHAWNGNRLYERTARMTFDYVLREMTAESGGFYSATDADSADADGHRHEGLYFVWTPATLQQALSEEDARLAIDLFGVTEAGNFEGNSILHLQSPLPDYARANEFALPALIERVDSIAEQLRVARTPRPAPLRDDKIITSWNGMMIASLARASQQLQTPEYLAAAQRAARYLLENHQQSDGRLWRASLQGRASVAAAQEDYAWLGLALTALYDQDADPHWLTTASQLAQIMIDDFWDSEQHGFFMSQANPEVALATRPKDGNDGATPSGNAAGLQLLVALHLRTGEAQYRNYAEQLLAAYGGRIQQQPDAFASMLVAARELRQGSSQLPVYAARGRVRVNIENGLTDAGSLSGTLRVTLADGWHVQANQPNQPEYVGTQLLPGEGWEMAAQNWPAPQPTEVDFLEAPLLLYSGEITSPFTIRSAVATQAERQPRLSLKLQACDDRLCLPPETITLPLPPAENQANSTTSG